MEINIKSVLTSGFAAGIIISLSAVTMVPVANNDMGVVLANRGCPPLSNAAMVYFCCISFVFGISLIFLYAALRPRIGSWIIYESFGDKWNEFSDYHME